MPRGRTSNSSSQLQLRPSTRRSHFPALASRVLPIMVLAAGLIWLGNTLNQAHGQQAGFGQPSPTGFAPQSQLQPAPTAPFNQSNFNGASQPVYQTAQNALGGGNVQSAIPPAPAQPETGTEPSKESAEAETSSGPSLIARVMSGGWLMLPLALCSLVVMALSMERLLALRRGRVIPKPFVHRFTECVEDGVLSYDEATELCKEFECPVSEVFRAALRRWGRPMLEIEQAVMDAGDRVSDGLKKYLRVFHAISNVAPLIGLLGTVIGMIRAFEAINAQANIGQPDMLASGISVALITTAGGLSVAIPAYLAYMYFSAKSDQYLGEIEKLCQRVIDCISEENLETTSSRSSKRRAA